MTIVVIPKSQAECNQVVSALHSHKRRLWSTTVDEAIIKVGCVVILWDWDFDYAVRPLANPVVDLVKSEEVPVNRLYNRLRLYAPHRLHSQG